MAVYLIADIEITDPVNYESYRKQVMPTLEAYGGRFIVRGSPGEPLEGNWQPGRVVVVEFENMERARAWWNSEEYREPKALRQRTATSRIIFVEGV